MRSRSRRPHQSIVIAPMSSAPVASQNRWLAIRFSSRWITRSHCARGGHLLLEQRLDRGAVGHRVRVVGEVVHPLDERDRLPVLLVLAALLDAGVDVADDRLDVAHVLALELAQQPQHPVRGGVVRAEVDREQLLSSSSRCPIGRSIVLDRSTPRARGTGRRARSGGSSLIPARELVLVEGEQDRLAADREVAPLRMADVVLGHEDAAQVGVAVELDAEEVVDLALVEVGGGEEVDDGRQSTGRRSSGGSSRRGAPLAPCESSW